MAPIVYYNAPAIKRLIFEHGWSSIPEQYRRGADGAFFNGYDHLAEFFEQIPFVDRTNQLRHFVAVTNVCPMPVFDRLDNDFEELCNRRAFDLGSTGKEIILFWSGGIDSTVALLALIRGGYSEQLNVVMTHNSLLENPRFYEQFITGKLRSTILNSEDVRQNYVVAPRKILVTGELGDQLFGSMTIFRYTFAQLMSPWQNHVSQIVQDFIAPVINASERPIISLFDFLWWMNFALKWQNVKYRFIARAEHICSIEQMCHFFDADYFQKWAVLTREPKILNHHRTYKWAAKLYIHKYTNDDDFLNHKLKVPSLRSNPGKSNPMFLFADGKRLTL